MDFLSIKGGFPHSEVHGSKLIRSSPRLIAAYHVLHRLCMPRHPPNALISLDRSHCLCPSLVDVPKGRDKPDYLLQSSPDHDAINVFDTTPLQARRCTASIMSLRPASRDKSDDARSGNINSISPVRGNLAATNNRPIFEQASLLPPSPPQSPAGEAIKRIIRFGLGRSRWL